METFYFPCFNQNHRDRQIERASESNQKSRSNSETRLFVNDRNGDEDDASTSTPPPTTTSIHSFSSPWMPNWEQNNKQRPCLPVMVQQNSRRASKNKERKLAENNGNQQNAIAIATLPRNIAVPPPLRTAASNNKKRKTITNLVVTSWFFYPVLGPDTCGQREATPLRGLWCAEARWLRQSPGAANKK